MQSPDTRLALMTFTSVLYVHHFDRVAMYSQIKVDFASWSVGWGLLGLIFAGYVRLASQNPNSM